MPSLVVPGAVTGQPVPDTVRATRVSERAVDTFEKTLPLVRTHPTPNIWVRVYLGVLR